MDAGIVGKEAEAAGDTVTSFINSNIYQEDNGKWHMAATMYLKNDKAYPNTKNWTVIVHAHPADPVYPKDWIVDTLLVGSLFEPVQANYDGKYFEDDGKIYLIYSKRLSATRAEDGIVAQPMDSYEDVAKVEPAVLLAPDEADGGLNSELFFGLGSSADFRLVETGNITKVEGKYVIAYSTGAYYLPGYKIGIAWSDTVIPRPGVTYRKLLKRDTSDVWGQSDHLEVIYLLQSQKSGWPNYAASEVLAPGVPSIVQATDGRWDLFFAGYAPDDAPLVTGTNEFQPQYRRPYTLALSIHVPHDLSVEEASDAELASWITSQQVVSVSGNSMTLNGTPWLSRGVTLRGLVAPAAFLQTHYPSAYTAQIHYGIPELNAARAFGVDTLRFQVSQPSLDSESPLYDSTYVAQLVAAMKLARQRGFVVMIMMQDEPFSGEPHPHPLATEETVRDWDYLATQFGTDRGVLFELYNEPELIDPTETNWALWANGDPSGNSAVAPHAVGMQTLINRLRNEGCVNVFILDGLDFAQTLANLPVVTDSLNQIVYAVHPYSHGHVIDESEWARRFGNLSASVPVYADEWSAEAGEAIGLGVLPNYRAAVDLLNYLRTHKISLGAGAFDIPGFMVQDVPGWTPTNYDNYAATNTSLDAGLLVKRLFETDYTQPIIYADGVTH